MLLVPGRYGPTRPYLPIRVPAPDFSIIRVPSRAPLRRDERIWASVTNFTSASRGALGSATDTLAYGSAVTAGDFLFVVIRMGTGATLNTVSDSVNAGNWTLSALTDNVGRQYWAYKENTGAGTPTLTFTFSASGQSPRYAMGEVGNTIGASSFDAADILATGTGTALAANSQTGATATYAQIGLMSISANETFTQNGSWTILGVEPTTAGTSRLAVVYQEVTSSASRAPAVDCGASSTWIAFSVMVKQNSSAVATTHVQFAPRMIVTPPLERAFNATYSGPSAPPVLENTYPQPTLRGRYNVPLLKLAQHTISAHTSVPPVLENTYPQPTLPMRTGRFLRPASSVTIADTSVVVVAETYAPPTIPLHPVPPLERMAPSTIISDTTAPQLENTYPQPTLLTRLTKLFGLAQSTVISDTTAPQLEQTYSQPTLPMRIAQALERVTGSSPTPDVQVVAPQADTFTQPTLPTLPQTVRGRVVPNTAGGVPAAAPSFETFSPVTLPQLRRVIYGWVWRVLPEWILPFVPHVGLVLLSETHIGSLSMAEAHLGTTALAEAHLGSVALTEVPQH